MPDILEVAGALLALAYLLLANIRRWWAWIPYIVSSVLYLPVFWKSGLVFNALLQLFFIGMGVKGLKNWRDEGSVVLPVQWPAKRHVRLVTLWLTAGFALGLGASFGAEGMTPFADAAIAVGSVVATYLTVERVAENWLYWIVIDVMAVITLAFQGLWVSATLYGVYCALCVSGFWAWRRAARQGSLALR